MAEFLLVLRREGFANICAQTVNRYVREEANIRQHASNPQHADRSRQSRVAMPEVEALLYEWIQTCERRNMRLTGVIICEKARLIAHELSTGNGQTISFSDGWLTRFKARFGIKQYTFHGEAASAPTETLEEHRQAIKAILARYAPDNRFNVDETGLNYRHVPGSGLAIVRCQESRSIRLG